MGKLKGTLLFFCIMMASGCKKTKSLKPLGRPDKPYKPFMIYDQEVKGKKGKAKSTETENFYPITAYENKF